MPKTTRPRTSRKVIRVKSKTISYATTTNKKRILNALKSLHKGSLHKQLGLKPNQKIPTKLLAKAARSKNQTIRRQAILAETLHRFQNH